MRNQDNHITIESKGGASAEDFTISHQHLPDTILGNGHNPCYLNIAWAHLQPSNCPNFFAKCIGSAPGAFLKAYRKNNPNFKNRKVHHSQPVCQADLCATFT